MAWQIKQQYVHKGLGHHVVLLHDPASDSDHVLQIIVGHDSCPVCGHVKVAENVTELNPKELINREIAALEEAHGQAHEYATRHRIPIMGPNGKAR